MDYRTGVSAGARSTHDAGPKSVRAEQAIFTSIRTPTGEGYRLIAMSPGITSEERAEITRRSPSHGGLCSTDPAASALSSYPLCTSRQCVAWTRYAGREHTSRGGQRVHTHLAVLEPEGFRIMQCDPFRVHAAMQKVLVDEPCLKPSPCLECLHLSAPDNEAHATFTAGREELERACRVAVELLGHGVMLVVGADAPMKLLQSMFLVLPQTFRASLAVSADLHYALSRQIQLTCVQQNSPELQRAIAGQDVHVLDLGSPAAQEETAYPAWFQFVLERRAQGRLAESIALADELDAQTDEATLARIVSVCRDADCVERASQTVLEELVTRYANLQPSHPVEGRLVRQLLSGAVRRASELQHRSGQLCAAVCR